MIKLKSLGLIAAIGLVTISSCKKDEESTTPSNGNLNLNISGLENLGSNFTYEGWVIVDGAPVTTGTFNVDDMGNMSKTSFSISTSNLNNASAFVLTIEPVPDSDAAPSDVHILAGDFSGNSASLTIDHGAAIGDDFTSSTGGYILATPTDGGSMDDEHSGVWWLDPSGPSATLNLPTLPAGWEYEGWAVIDGTPVTTGKFTAVDMADMAAPYSGTAAAGPPFPGEDFLMNAPSNLTFPTDLSGKTVVISVEPMPDNSEAPFLLKPLVGMVPAMANVHSVYNMDNNAANTNPTGTASR